MEKCFCRQIFYYMPFISSSRFYYFHQLISEHLFRFKHHFRIKRSKNTAHKKVKLCNESAQRGRVFVQFYSYSVMPLFSLPFFVLFLSVFWLLYSASSIIFSVPFHASLIV